MIITTITITVVLVSVITIILVIVTVVKIAVILMTMVMITNLTIISNKMFKNIIEIELKYESGE